MTIPEADTALNHYGYIPYYYKLLQEHIPYIFACPWAKKLCNFSSPGYIAMFDDRMLTFHLTVIILLKNNCWKFAALMFYVNLSLKTIPVQTFEWEHMHFCLEERKISHMFFPDPQVSQSDALYIHLQVYIFKTYLTVIPWNAVG